MKHLLVLVFCIGTLVAAASAGNDYLWGEIGANDYLIAKDSVTKAFLWGSSVSKKYVFKQKELNALTITAIRVIDQRSKNGATAQLISGGPGSKGATIQFKSQKSAGIKDLVEIWAR